MEKLILITEALEYIEANLTEEIKTDDIAEALYCSKSTIEKLFKYVTNISIKDYSIRRRMSRAAKELNTNPEISLLDLGIKYGYGSNEAFTRAFKSVWHVSPSDYRKNPMRFELYPALKFEPELMEDEKMKSKKKVDISELYDYIRDRENCYIVAVDIKCLIPINDISVEAGDLAILTALGRLENACGEDDIVFRIGGDEFVAVTGSKEEEYAMNIVRKVLGRNGETFEWNGRKIPLNLYATAYKHEKRPLRYAELFSNLQEQLDVIKTDK